MFKTISIKDKNLSDYEEVYIPEFPTAYLYDRYDRISIRVLTLREVQNYSTYDINNPFNFSYKIDEILENCVLYYKSDIDQYIHYSHIYETDRLWLLYTIREKTFPNGFILEAEINKTSIKLLRQNIDIWKCSFLNTDILFFICFYLLLDWCGAPQWNFCRQFY